jgi:transcription elongation factor GreA
MKKQFRLTQAGIDELQEELAKLKGDRKAVAERIKDAREFGDLAENAEYSAARLEQDKAETRIAEIENILLNVEVIKSRKGDSKVALGSKITLKSEDGKTKEFQVVGTVEADPLNGKISDESPIGKQLLGKKLGEKVEIKTPAETKCYTITEIA